MSTNISENFCQAVSLIANDIVSGLKFDKTILCTITDTTQCSEGIYKVKDGESTYTVTSQNKSLALHSQVYVLIPNGDYDAEKIIVSSKIGEYEGEKGYSLPFDTVIPIHTLFNSENTTYSLTANKNGENNIGSAVLIHSPSKALNFGLSFNRLALSGQFTSSFNSSDEVIKGDYGIVVLISGVDIAGKDVSEKKYVFNCTDFFGNPYALTETEQSVSFDISSFDKITSILIQFQESGNFYETDGEYVAKKTNNLKLKNFKAILGFDINDYNNNDLILSSSDDLGFNTEGRKSVAVNWVRRRNNNTLFGINNIPEDVTSTNFNYLNYLKSSGSDKETSLLYNKMGNDVSIYWYKYLLKDGIKDSLLNEEMWKLYRHNNPLHYSSTTGSTNTTLLLYDRKYFYMFDIDNKTYYYGYNSSVYSKTGKLYRFTQDFKYDSKVSVTGVKLNSSNTQIEWTSSSNEKKTGKRVYPSVLDTSFYPSLDNYREKIKCAIAISGCLRKRTLRLQQIDVTKGDGKYSTEGSVLKEVKFHYAEEEPPSFKDPDYEDYYYSPDQEINVQSVFDSIEKGSDNKPLELILYEYDSDKAQYLETTRKAKKNIVEWVRYYKREVLAVNDKDEIQKDEDGKDLYVSAEMVYLNADEYKRYSEAKYKSTNKKLYKLTITPIVLFQSNEVVFTNTDTGSYKNLNLISDIKLSCTDDLQGKYFIYGLDSTIPSGVTASERKLRVEFKTINSKDIVSDNVIIQWKMPAANTMIAAPKAKITLEDSLPYESLDHYKDANKANELTWTLNSNKTEYISNKLVFKNSASGQSDETISLTMDIVYGIEKYYSPSYSNNTITCQIYKQIKIGEKEFNDDDIKLNVKTFELFFGPSGTNGTNYTFSLNLGKPYKKENNTTYTQLSNEKRSFLQRNEKDVYVEVEANLYDGKNLVINAPTITWGWLISPTYKASKKSSDGKQTKSLQYKALDLVETGGKAYIRSMFGIENIDGDLPDGWAESNKKDTFASTDYCAILKASINYNSKVLEAYLPIPMSFNDNVNYYEGADKIIYNSNGSNPSYYKNFNRIFGNNNTLFKSQSCHIHINRSSNEVSADEKDYYPTFKIGESIVYENTAYTLYDIGTSGYVYGYNKNKKNKESDDTEYWTIQKFDKKLLKRTSEVKVYKLEFDDNKNIVWYTNKNGGSSNKRTGPKYSLPTNFLSPSPIYYSNYSSTPISIIIKGIAPTSTSTEAKNCFVQPLLILQNRFGNAMLNEWDGELKVDEENNRILAAQIAAGTKNTNNTFTGVIMGDVADESLDGGVVKTGLYGYHQGDLSFGFKDDGTAYIGKSGGGRIHFDGNKGIIESENYSKNDVGTYLDLQTGHMKFRSTKGRGEISLSGIGSTEEPYLKIVERKDQVIKTLKIKVRGSDGKTTEIEKSFYLFTSSNNSDYLYGYSYDFRKDYPDYVNKLPKIKKSNATADGAVSAEWANAYHISVATNYTSMTWYAAQEKTEANKRTGTLYEIPNQQSTTIFLAQRGTYYLQGNGYKDGYGTKLDLSNGQFTSENIAGKITIDPASSTSLFKVERKGEVGTDGKVQKTTLINIGSATYLQSMGYSSASNTGTKINLEEDTFQIKSAGTLDGSAVLRFASSSPYFRIQKRRKNSDNTFTDHTLISFESSNQYIQSEGYVQHKKGVKINLASGGFSITSPLDPTSLTEGGVLISNGSNGYFRVSKNYEKTTENISISEGGLTKSLDFYFNPWGSSVIVRDRSTNKFYWGQFINRSGTTPWEPGDIPGLLEKYDTFEMKSNKVEGEEQVPYTGNIYCMSASSVAISYFLKYFKLADTINADHEIAMSGDYSYNSTNYIVNKANATASDGNKYTLQYRLAKLSSLNSSQKYKTFNKDKGGHFNSIAADYTTNKFYIATGMSGAPAGKNTLLACKYNKSEDSWSSKTHYLQNKSGTNLTPTSGIWQVAIEANTNILYALTAGLALYKYTTGSSETWKAMSVALAMECDTSKYTYQGMAVDDKYFYMPCIKKDSNGNLDYKKQYIHVLNKSDAQSVKYISLSGVDENYEIEEVAFNGKGSLYISFSARYGYKRVSKIYKISFSNKTLKDSISIGKAQWVIYGPSDDYITGQGFTLGYDETNGDYYFANAFISSSSNGAITVNYLNSTKTLLDSRIEAKNLINISSDSFYLRSANYKKVNGIVTGTFFDLKTGSLVTTNANITGTITAKAGKIGEWNIGTASIYYGSATFGANKAFLNPLGKSIKNTTLHSSSLTWVMGIGQKFGVTKDGALYVSGAQVKGKITATAGSIGGFEIADSSTTPSNGFWKNSISAVNKNSKNIYYASFIRNTGTIGNVVFGVKKTKKAFSSPPQIANWNSADDSEYVFSVTNEGKLTAVGAKITGDITATSGSFTGTVTATSGSFKGSVTATSGTFNSCTIKKTCTFEKNLQIGNWKIGTACLYYGNAAFTDGYAFLYPKGKSIDKFGGSRSWVLGVGSNFGVTSAGNLYCSNASIKGTIQAGSMIYIGTTNDYWLGVSNNQAYMHLGSITVTPSSVNIWNDLYLNSCNIHLYDMALSGANYRAKMYLQHNSGSGTTTYIFLQYNASTLKFGVDAMYLRLYGKTIYQGESATTITSDLRLKTQINTISERYENFFHNLKPITYKYTEGHSGRTHNGFIAQDVEAAILKSGLTTQDVAAYVALSTDRDDLNNVEYGLRYEEFIALNTHMIQKCLKRINELENEIKTLKAQL